MEEVIKIIQPMSSTIFWSIIVFIILTVVLWRFVFRPINAVISKRQMEIRENVDKAEIQNEEARKYLEEQKRCLEEARKEARKIIEESKIAAQKIREEAEERANRKAREIIDTAIAEINSERERSINEIRDRIVDIILSTTEKLIEKSLTSEEHKKLIEKSLEEMEKIG